MDQGIVGRGVPSAVREYRRKVSTRLWSGEGHFDLRADLTDLPEPRPARVPLTMEPCDDPGFTGFIEEAERVTGSDLEEIHHRQDWLEAGMRRLYVAWHDGQPAYCQWLVEPADEPAMEAAMPGSLHGPLGPGEVLVEGAYTFVGARGLGAMADCMGQLLRIAREGGARFVFTGVGADNIASLKGCARVGFVPVRLREARWRLGVFRSRESSGRGSTIWQAAS